MEQLSERQKEKLDMLMELDVDRDVLWRQDVFDAQALRNEQRQWRKSEMKLRWATLALVASEFALVAFIAWRVST